MLTERQKALRPLWRLRHDIKKPKNKRIKDTDELIIEKHVQH